MKNAALFVLAFALSLMICGASEAEAGKRQRCCIPQQCHPQQCYAPPGCSGPQQPCGPVACSSTDPCWCRQFPLFDDEVGNTLYYVSHNSGGCDYLEDIYRWYPTALPTESIPELCYTTTTCECENNPGSAKLERNRSQASVLLAKNAAAKKGVVTTLALNVADSPKATLASAMLNQATPLCIRGAYSPNARLADLWRDPALTGGTPPEIWGHHPWLSGWRVSWTPANCLRTYNGETRYIKVRGGGGAIIPVMVLFGRMNFDDAGILPPKNEHGNRPIALGIEVTRILGPDPAPEDPTKILSNYHALIRVSVSNVEKEVDIFTRQALR